MPYLWPRLQQLAMPIVTLTTDLGNANPYLGSILGGMMSIENAFTLRELTHGIQNYDIKEAAYYISTVHGHFPPGTIHVILAALFEQEMPGLVMMKARDQLFIAPDNGLLSLMTGVEQAQYYIIDVQGSSPAALRNALLLTLQCLLSPVTEEQAPWQEAEGIVKRISLQPVITGNSIRGTIQMVDGFDNAITNIHQSLFETVGGGRSYLISFRQHEPITSISEHYGAVGVGETLALFNDAGYLEIAINMGKAATLLGLRVDDGVQIDFQPLSS